MTEPEEMHDSDSDSEERSEEEKMKDYEQLVNELRNRDSQNILQDAGGSVDKDLENMAMKDSQVDQQFEAFKKRIRPFPDQVHTYCGTYNLMVMNSMQTCNSVTFYFMKKLIF